MIIMIIIIKLIIIINIDTY